MPARVIEDTRDVLAVHVPAGTILMTNWDVPPGQRAGSVARSLPSAKRQHHQKSVRLDQLRFYFPATWYSVEAAFRENELAFWYCNLEAPYARTPIGIDTRDFALDVVITPDGKHSLKDEEEFVMRRRHGLDSPEHQVRVRQAATEVVARHRAAAPPFDRNWSSAPLGAILHQPLALPTRWSDDFGTDRLLPRSSDRHGPD